MAAKLLKMNKSMKSKSKIRRPKLHHQAQDIAWLIIPEGLLHCHRLVMVGIGTPGRDSMPKQRPKLCVHWGVAT